MIPIPTPDRLIDPRLNHPRRTPAGRRQPSLLVQAGEGLFYLGFVGLLIAAAILCGALAQGLSGWLVLPAGVLGPWALVVICRRVKALAGVLEAILYGGLVASLHSEGQDPLQFSPAWIVGAVLALIFLWATYAALKLRAR
jgi:hypothetical protein